MDVIKDEGAVFYIPLSGYGLRIVEILFQFPHYPDELVQLFVGETLQENSRDPRIRLSQAVSWQSQPRSCKPCPPP
jgi:uncharacterized protein Usg